MEYLVFLILLLEGQIRLHKLITAIPRLMVIMMPKILYYDQAHQEIVGEGMPDEQRRLRTFISKGEG